MENESNISSNDPDLLLAKKIGAALPQLSFLSTEHNPLLEQLLRYKKAEAKKTYSIDSSALWNSIQSEIKESPKKAPLLTLTPSIKRFAIAASILFTAFLGSLIYQNMTGPTLIGESFSSMQTLNLSDGSVVTLRPYSKLYENEHTKTSSTYSLEGEAFFEVTNKPDRIFSVKTDRSKVQVLGTKFILSDWGNSSTVFLQEGRIQYSSLNTNQSVTLQPGQSSTIDDPGAAPKVISAEEDEYTDWLKNELVFQNKSVEKIFSELEQHFNIRIESMQDLENETLSGSLKLQDLSTVLGDLELVLGGTFSQTSDNVYVFRLDT